MMGVFLCGMLFAAVMPAAAAPLKTAEPPDPCTLVTLSDAEQILGSGATQKRSDTNDEEAQLSCIYRLKNLELNVSIFKSFDKVSQADLDEYHAKPLGGIGDRAFIVQPYGIMFEKHHIRYFVTYTDRTVKSDTGSDAGIDVPKSISVAKLAAKRAP
jgi:hypothetical protein